MRDDEGEGGEEEGKKWKIEEERDEERGKIQKCRGDEREGETGRTTRERIKGGTRRKQKKGRRMKNLEMRGMEIIGMKGEQG